MNKILLIRHGKTTQSEEGLISNDHSDSSLSPNGIVEINKKLQFLKSGAFRPDVILVSEKRRTYQSAIEIFPDLKDRIMTRNGLNEINKGFNCVIPLPSNWKNMTVAEWEVKYNYADNLKQRLIFKYPSGISIKNYIDVVVAEFKAIIRDYFSKNICIFAHNGSIKSILLYIYNRPKEDYFKLRVGYGDCFEANF